MSTKAFTRRDFVRLGLLAGTGAVGACGWDGGPRFWPRLLDVSRVNDWVGEHLFQSGSRLAREYPVSRRTGNLPAYFISNQLPRLDNPEAWELEIGGEVRKPMRLGLDRIRAMPHVTYTVKHYCVEGWTAIATWTGVPFHAISALVEPAPQARYVRFDSFDRAYYNGWDMKSAMHPQTILAWGHNDRVLTPEHGAPLRLYSPIKLGYKLTKYLTRVTFTRDRPGGYWEDQGYPWHAGI